MKAKAEQLKANIMSVVESLTKFELEPTVQDPPPKRQFAVKVDSASTSFHQLLLGTNMDVNRICQNHIPTAFSSSTQLSFLLFVFVVIVMAIAWIHI